MELIWPERLPTPFHDGYNYAPVSPFIRTPMDSGHARHRRRSRVVKTKINVSWKIPREDMKDFRYFVFELVGGSGWGFFQTPLLFDGDQCKMMKARFLDAETPFSVANEENMVLVVTAAVEVYELHLISQDDYYARNPDQLMLFGGNRLHHLLHVTMPGYHW